MIEPLFTKKIGGLFLDVVTSKAGQKYISLTSSKADASGQWVKTRIPVFADQVAPLIESLTEAQAFLA